MVWKWRVVIIFNWDMVNMAAVTWEVVRCHPIDHVAFMTFIHSFIHSDIVHTRSHTCVHTCVPLSKRILEGRYTCNIQVSLSTNTGFLLWCVQLLTLNIEHANSKFFAVAKMFNFFCFGWTLVWAYVRTHTLDTHHRSHTKLNCTTSPRSRSIPGYSSMHS